MLDYCNPKSLYQALEMDTKNIIWRQFGAAIDMLKNAIVTCPDDLWGDRSHQPEYWYLVYHTLFWLDLYLSDSFNEFTPPIPFTLDELDPAGLLPERVYTKEELQTYLEHGRSKCRSTIQASADLNRLQTCRPEWADMTMTELLIYNLRHVQHHTAQLNMILRQRSGSAPGWIARAE